MFTVQPNKNKQQLEIFTNIHPIIHTHVLHRSSFDLPELFCNNNTHQTMIDQVIESRNMISTTTFASHVLDIPTITPLNMYMDEMIDLLAYFDH